MDHKAYMFDWRSFERDELSAILKEALSTDKTEGLITYIETNLEQLKDPYEGNPLDEDWREMLENRDVHEYGDFALTRFYDPSRNRGLSQTWILIDDTLSSHERSVCLGTSFGVVRNEFDPGRQGAYFQSPHDVRLNLGKIAEFRVDNLQLEAQESLADFQVLLKECSEKEMGLYVTF